MDQEFLTIYIEKMNAKIEEYVKKDILTETQLELTKRINLKLNAEILELKSKNDALIEDINKKKKKEVNTF